MPNTALAETINALRTERDTITARLSALNAGIALLQGMTPAKSHKAKSHKAKSPRETVKRLSPGLQPDAVIDVLLGANGPVRRDEMLTAVHQMILASHHQRVPKRKISKTLGNMEAKGKITSFTTEDGKFFALPTKAKEAK